MIHPFRDGNGRTARALANLLFLRSGLPPVLFEVNAKDEYKKALGEADATGRMDALHEMLFRQMLKTHSVLTDKAL